MTLTQSRMGQCLLRIHLEAMEIPLHETCVTLTQRKYRNKQHKQHNFENDSTMSEY